MPPEPPIYIPFYDKWLHLLIYAILSLTYLNAATQGFRNISGGRIFLALVLTSVYGITDEVHQLFVPGRFCDWADWLADTVGGCIAIGGMAYSFSRKKGDATSPLDV